MRCSKCAGPHDYRQHDRFCEICKSGKGKLCLPKCHNCRGPHFSNSKDCVFYINRSFFFFFLKLKGYIRYVLRIHQVHYLTNASQRDALIGLVDDHLLNNTKVPMMHINGRRRRKEADKKKRRKAERAMERTGIKRLSRLQKRQDSQNRPCRVTKRTTKIHDAEGIAFMCRGTKVRFGTQ